MKQVPKPRDTRRLFVSDADVALPPTGLGFKVEIERILGEVPEQPVQPRPRAIRAAVKGPIPDGRGTE